ncbi:NUDIX domain-containing protein, partial [Candidatus Woesearchaeota archaeon]|nr:NUDIX domain-containing protein [Candidatus Woesearchaeota archaeon]
MKAVILAAGKGVRMLPLTLDKPKPLIEINGKPFLLHLLERLHDAGFEDKDIAIVAGYKKEKMEDFLEENKLPITVIEQEALLGTGDAVSRAREFVDDEDFVVVGGDNLFSAADLKAIQQDDGYCHVAAWKVDNPSRYGVLLCKGNMLLKVIEKPKEFIGNLINAGLYKFTSDIFEALEQIRPSERGELELTDAISLLAESRKVKVMMLQDYWLDLGRNRGFFERFVSGKVLGVKDLLERPKVGIGVILVKEGKVLLLKRKNAHGEGTWGFPGGHLELHEEFEDCVKREVEEETGISVNNIHFAGLTNDIFT